MKFWTITALGQRDHRWGVGVVKRELAGEDAVRHYRADHDGDVYCIRENINIPFPPVACRIGEIDENRAELSLHRHIVDTVPVYVHEYRLQVMIPAQA